MKEKAIVHDISPDMKIELEDGRVVTLGEMETMVREAWEAVRLRPGRRIEKSETDTDIGQSYRPTDWRCSISKHGFHIGGRRENRRWDLSEFAELLKGLDT